ncbi:MAG TPA: hypothetical protein VFC68_05945 [Treponemataceae bacterium]|nr:hypothetical protein [Treponemataceae bacterium]
MTAKNPYVNDILQWRDFLSKMPDHHFFNLLRMYLGDIKTPFNKQTLIEQLGAFLRQTENQQNIVRLLSKTDILLIAAIDALSKPTQEKLLVFFGVEFSFGELYERLMNLEERLLVFRVADGDSERVFKVTPLLRAVLNPLLTADVLTPNAIIQSTFDAQGREKLSFSLVGAWFSYLEQNPDLCKADGAFKKKTLSQIKSVFPSIENADMLLLLTNAFHNLQLFHSVKGAYKPVIKNWQNFSLMDKQTQFSYVCAGALGRYSREQLHLNAQLVYDILSCLCENNFTKKVLIRAGYLQMQNKARVDMNFVKKGRFATMVKKKLPNPILDSKSTNENKTNDVARLLSIMQMFRLLECVGKTKNGKNVYHAATELCEAQNNSHAKPPLKESNVRGSIVINAGFSVTILQELSIASLLDIIRCMEIVRLDGIAEYKITRQSCMRCFDEGFSPQKIKAALAPTLAHEMPQNLQFSLDDWYKNYCSTSLYKGYVLSVDAEKQNLIKNMPGFSEYIIKELGPGIYLLDFSSDEEAESVISKTSLDFIGAVKKTKKSVTQAVPYSQIKPTQKDKKNVTVEKQSKKDSVGVPKDFLNDLKNKVSKKNLSEEQEDGLLSRIHRKIIVNEEQLRADSVRPEKIEASGMDFLGKVHVVEHAYSSKSLLKINVNKTAAINGQTELLGVPLSIEKKDDDMHVTLQIEPSGEITILSIGQAKSVKRIRGAIFKEHT